MPLRFLLDENLRGPVWRAVEKHNSIAVHPLDVTRVCDPPDLGLGSGDPEILAWCEAQQSILVSADRATLATQLAEHLRRGGHCPGIFLIRPSVGITEIVNFLVAAAYASEPEEWEDQYRYIP